MAAPSSKGGAETLPVNAYTGTVSIKCDDGIVLRAHKEVLQSRSVYFDTMFKVTWSWRFGHTSRHAVAH